MKTELGRLVAGAIERGLIERTRPPSRADSRFVDGWQYGVMYSDGSVIARWSGASQRQRALEWIEESRLYRNKDLPGLVLVRRRMHYAFYSHEATEAAGEWQVCDGYDDPRRAPRSP